MLDADLHVAGIGCKNPTCPGWVVERRKGPIYTPQLALQKHFVSCAELRVSIDGLEPQSAPSALIRAERPFGPALARIVVLPSGICSGLYL
jgi:hypothetical protein